MAAAASGVHRKNGGPPFQLLEITLISAQDLASVGNKSMETYAVAWVNPDRRLTTSVDRDGHTNPSWNDKFVFRVPDAFLSAPTSAVNIEIYAVSWLRDVRLGVARFLVSCLVPTNADVSGQIPNPVQGSPPEGGSNMCFVALQVRRPSGRPQGILNVGAVVLDSPMRSMPLYTELSASAVGYRQLIKDIGLRKLKRRRRQHDKDGNKDNQDDDDTNNRTVHLHRTQSERSTTTNTINMITSSQTHPPNNNDDGSDRNSDVCLSPLEARPGAEISKLKEYWQRKGMQENNNINGGNEDGRRLQRRHFRRRTDGGGLFSCFANGYGFEFSIKCGGNKANRNKVNGSRKVLLRPDSLLE